MKHAIAIIIALCAAGAFWFVPIIAEGASSPCAAVVYRSVHVDAGSPLPNRFVGDMLGTIGTPIIVAAMDHDHPNVPPEVSCAALWWHSLVNPSVLEVPIARQ